MPVPNTFANATATIPLSQLDANFATTITLGNTAIQLGNTVSTLNNMTLANVTVTSGNVTITNVTVTTANVTTANIATAQIANVTVSGTGTFAAGSNTAPSITTSGDTNTGIYFPAADTIAFTEGGVESMRIDSAGNVGIGTTSPASKLQVSNTSGYSTITVTGNSASGGVLSFVDSAGVTTQRILGFGSTAGENTSLRFDTNGSEKMRLDSSGNLGLGVTPSAWDTSVMRAVQVGTGATFAGDTPGAAFRARILANAYYGSGAYRYIGSGPALLHTVNANSSTFEWNIAGSGTAGNAITFTQAMTLDASGNLGVGTTSPGNRLHVSASNGDVARIAGTTRSLYFGVDTSGTMISTGAGQTGVGTYYSAGSDFMYFMTGSTERARITSDGYFKATSTGTYSAGTTGAVHEFNTSSVNGTIVNFYNQAASTPNGIYVQYTAADPNDATRYVFGSQQNTGVWIYRIYSNGTVAARSDVKWKKNIETARDGYAEDLAKLRVVKYNWYNHDDGTPKELGLIAQEVEQVFPGLVTTDEQTRNEIKTREVPAVLDEEGNEVEPARTEEYTEKVGIGEYSKSIKFSVLPIMLLKAVQEQQAMIEELKAKVAALENA